MTKTLFSSPRSVAFLSVCSNTLLVAAKIVAGIVTGSVAIISEGIHSSLDLLAAVIAFISVTISGRPADSQHPYGHGKVENISGTIEAILILAAVFFIVRQAVHKLIAGGEVASVDLGLAVMLVSIVVNIFVSRKLFRAGKVHESPALLADAHHLSTDVLTSVGVLIGLLLVRITKIYWLDPVVAIVVAAMMFYIGAGVLASSFKDLLDHRLPEEEEARIKKIIDTHTNLFVEYHKFRTRKAGKMRYIEMHLVVSCDESIKEAHDFCDHLEEDILSEFPTANITIHIEPNA